MCVSLGQTGIIFFTCSASFGCLGVGCFGLSSAGRFYSYESCPFSTHTHQTMDRQAFPSKDCFLFFMFPLSSLALNECGEIFLLFCGIDVACSRKEKNFLGGLVCFHFGFPIEDNTHTHPHSLNHSRRPHNRKFKRRRLIANCVQPIELIAFSFN